MLVFPMEKGLEVFEWKRIPDDVKWTQAIQNRAGGGKGKEIFNEYISYVKESKSQLARRHS